VSRITLQVLMGLTAAALVVTPAAAQRRARARPAAALERPSYGPHLGYNFDAKDLLLGAQLTYPITPQLALYPTFDYYFQSGGSLWALNGDVKYHPPTRAGYFYFGGGLNISRHGWTTEIGPGRHPISSAFFWYVKCPAGGLAEYYADEDYVTPAWKPRELTPSPEMFAEWAITGGIDGNSRRQASGPVKETGTAGRAARD